MPSPITFDFSGDAVGSTTPSGLTLDGSASVATASTFAGVTHELHTTPDDGSAHHALTTATDNNGGDGTFSFRICINETRNIAVAEFRKQSSSGYAVQLESGSGSEQVVLYRNAGGQQTALATVPVGSNLVATNPHRVTAVASGSQLSVEVFDETRSLYLGSNGTFGSSQGNCIGVVDQTPITGSGKWGYAWFAPGSVPSQPIFSTLSFTPASTPPATITSVTVSPANATVDGGSSRQFTATVSGANNPPSGVTWTATDSTGTALGMIDGTGLFVAPSPVSTDRTVTITARSTFDTTKVGSATVTIPAGTANTGITFDQVQAVVNQAKIDTLATVAQALASNQSQIQGSIAASQTAIVAGQAALANAIANVAALFPAARLAGIDKLQASTLPNAVLNAKLASLTVDASGGVQLSPVGLDRIATTPPPQGQAPTFAQMIVMTWRRWYGKHFYDGTYLTGYADDGTTILTRQQLTGTATTKTQGPLE